MPYNVSPGSDPAVERRQGEQSDPTMQAIVQRQYGSADVLHIERVDRPTIGDDEALVRVIAAGVDRGTWHLMEGLPKMVRFAGFGVRAPKQIVPGQDVAGVVEAVGRNVTRLAPGDDVFGTAKGSWAEFAAAKADKLAIKPAHLTFEQAAAVPFAGLTALQGLTDVGRMATGQHVLVIGASGGVGTFAVQIAKALGATVTGVCSTGKVDLVRSLGADHVIDYLDRDPLGGDLADGSDGYDLILDIGGNSTLRRLRRALTARGTLVIVGGEGGGRWVGGVDRGLRALALSPFVSHRLTMFVAKEHYGGLVRLLELVAARQLTPAIERTYRLDEAPEAMRHLAAGRARGKLVVTVRPDVGVDEAGDRMSR